MTFTVTTCLNETPCWRCAEIGLPDSMIQPGEACVTGESPNFSGVSCFDCWERLWTECEGAE